MSSRPFLFALVSAILIVCQPLLAAKPKPGETYGPVFTNNPTQLTATGGQAYSIALASLLSNQGTGTLSWSLSGQPAWLSIDSTGKLLVGNPKASDSGTFHFFLSVNDGESGVTNHDTYITVKSPPYWPPNMTQLDLGIQNEDSQWTFDLKTVVTDPTGGPTTYAATGLPGWMKLDPNTGILSGTPLRADVGNYQGILITATGPGGTSAPMPAFGTVLIHIHAPSWTANPITIADATQDTAYNVNISQYALNPEGTPLTFTIADATPPAWLQIGATSGNLFGMPTIQTLPPPKKLPQSVSVTLTTTIMGQQYTATTVFNFNIIHVNHAPVWAADPIVLPNWTATNAFKQNLSGSASDPDEDPLTFSITSFSGPGTNWATIDPKTGIISGTPQNTNVGLNSWQVTVTDPSNASATTTVEITILRANVAPNWLNHPTIVADAKENASYAVDLNAYVNDPNKDPSDPISITMLSGPSWLQITSTGVLMGTPGPKDLGLVTTLQARVSNKEGKDDTAIQFTVAKVSLPPIWIVSPITIEATEDQPLAGVTVAPYAKGQNPGDTLTFSIVSGPTWATMASNGAVTGTPGSGNTGAQTFTVRATTQDGLTADDQLIIDVKHVNHPPYWTANPITLPDATEASQYAQSVASYAKDPDGDTLTFSIESGPAWITINAATGELSGTPAHSDTGVANLTVRATDPYSAYADTVVTFNVKSINHPPYWRQNPIQMPDAYENRTYAMNLAPYAVDPDGDTLHFAKVQGPDWLFVNDNGTISGTPLKKDVGTYTAIFSVTDGKSDPVPVNANGQVIHVDQPPVIDANMPTIVFEERAVKTVSLTQWVTDPDGDTLKFVLTDQVPSWLSLSPSGDLTANQPAYKDIGNYTFGFSVSDGTLVTQGLLHVQVIRVPRPPVWLQDPITKTAETNVAFTDTLANLAKDLDGIPITFSKKSGPDWLTVDTSGTLSGTPQETDLGDDTFTVSVCNDKLCADAQLIITVKPGTQVDVTQIDQAVPGARSENLWVVDNSKFCDSTIHALKENIHYYFDDLQAAGIHHAGVYLSADIEEFDGIPIHSEVEPIVFDWNEASVADDFVDRVNEGRSRHLGHCDNCYNSPIWAIHLFFNRIPELASELSDRYFLNGVPLDTMIITHQRDHYKRFAQNDPNLANYTPVDYANAFIKTNADQNKAFRVSAIAPECPRLTEQSGDQQSVAEENAYRMVTQATKGTYYARSCKFDMAEILHDYASRVIFRAYVHAKTNIQLSKPAKDPSSIQVTIGGVEIPATNWSYDASTNTVTLKWYLIDQGQLKPGDQIRIQYRVS